MPSQDLASWLLRLESLHPKDIELGLDRVAAVAARLELLSPDATVVTVAGTNGKGSTTAVLEALALDAGHSAGVYTSPHLIHFNERIKLNGAPVTDGELVAAFESIDAERGDVPLTFFEFSTLAALLIFKQAGAEFLILEVGLGGRLDAVNIVDPDLAIITSISLDHQEWLGDDRDTIALEKAGILRQGLPVIVADPEPPVALCKRIEELSCPVTWFQSSGNDNYPGCALRPENIFAATAAAGHFGFAPTRERLVSLLSQLRVPGRLQPVERGGRHIVLDVAHNPAATANLACWLETHVTGPAIAVFAALSDKDIHAMIRSLKGRFVAWYVVGLPGVARALPASELAGKVAEAGAGETIICRDIAEAWNTIQLRHPSGTLVVFGSFYTVAGFLQLPEDERKEA